jgi:hypothetical protein
MAGELDRWRQSLRHKVGEGSCEPAKIAGWERLLACLWDFLLFLESYLLFSPLSHPCFLLFFPCLFSSSSYRSSSLPSHQFVQAFKAQQYQGMGGL